MHPLCMVRSYLVGKKLVEAIDKLKTALVVEGIKREMLLEVAQSNVKHVAKQLQELLDRGCFPEKFARRVEYVLRILRETERIVRSDPGGALLKLDDVESRLNDIFIDMEIDYAIRVMK